MKTIYKPWGKEEWIELNDSYCYKRIYINEGHKTSLQYHNFKKETNYIISGQAEIWLENDEGEIIKEVYGPGQYYNVVPPKKHRVIALTDLIMQEVSTPEVDDVIRVEDDTNRPDGKIESEHKTPAVLILCAGLGSRLKKLTDNINKTLLPINNRAIISHIIEKFPKEYDFVVAVGYKGDSVREYCNLAYPHHKFTFVNVENYDPSQTGPGTSALLCSEHLQRPFYFIMGDCIIDSQIPSINGNWLGVHPTSYPEKYSTVKIDDRENIISFVDKSTTGYDLAFVGFGGISDYSTFWKELSVNIKKGELVSAFESPEIYPTLKSKRLKWLDTGNLDDLDKARQYFNDKPLSLKKDIEEITYKDGGKFLKFTQDKDLLERRKIRGSILADIIPPNFNVGENFLYYDWVEGKTLYDHGGLDVFNNFLIKLEFLISEVVPGNKEDLKKFYVDKTRKRMESFVTKYGESYFISEHEINEKKRPSLDLILSDEKIFSSLYDNPFYSNFHGDLHFDNMILSDEGKYYYIDWRDCFGENVQYGDIYYDLSKFYGGLIIPYNLMKDENNITYFEGSYSIKYQYPISSNLIKFKSDYEQWVEKNGFDLNKIKFITGLIFLNMSPLHDGKFGKMLWFKSIEMLDDYKKHNMGLRM
jgi:NDP-sugar pyrophosphorylase family protein/mannose-6-phosphate isomerase-like protein (cupin superfamily)/thiamine kinase-like enzyme